MLQTWLAVAQKEFRHCLRERSLIFGVLLLQVLEIALLGFIDANPRDLPTVIVDQDESSESRELIQKLRATQTLRIAYLTSSSDQARAHIRAGRARVAVVIPPDYHRQRAAHAQAHLLALVDGSDAVASESALLAIRGLAAEMTVDREASPRSGIRAHTLVLFNPAGKTSNFTLPGLLAILLMGEWVAFAGIALARERENETFERLLMTPLDLRGYVLGKATPYVAASLANGIVLVIIVNVVFGVPINGSVALLLLAMVLFTLTLVGLGIYFGSEAEDQMDVSGRVVQLQFPMLFLCGYIFPLSSLPKWLLPIAYVLPPTHMIEIMRGITLRGVGLAELWVHFLYLVVAPLVLFPLAVKKVRAILP